MSEASDDDRRSRSDSQHSYDDHNYAGGNNGPTFNTNNTLLGLGENERSARPQFHLSTIPNELGDEELRSFDVKNDVMVFVGSNGKVIVRDSKVDTQPIVASIPNAHKGFMSPDGHHVLISTLDGILHYYSLHNRKAVAVQKVNSSTGAKQAMVVETVCWNTNAHGQAVTTGNVLLGSKTGGLIFAARVDVTTSPAAATFAHCRHVIQIPESDNSPIHGLEVVRNESTHSTIVMVTTPSRMYPFVGRDRKTDRAYAPLNEEDVLKLYKNGKQCEILDMGAKSQLTQGRLAIMRPTPRQAASYAWLSVAGVTHGLFSKTVTTKDNASDELVSAEDRDEDGEGSDDGSIEYDDGFTNVDESVEVEAQFHNQCHIPLGQRGVGANTIYGAGNRNDPAQQQQQQRANNSPTSGPNGNSGYRIPTTPPIDIAISAFHIYVLYENRMIVLGHPPGLSWRAPASNPNGELTDTDVNSRIRFDPFEHRNVRPFTGMVRDAETRKVFFYNKFAVYELSVEQEHLGQWKLFLQQAIDNGDGSPGRGDNGGSSAGSGANSVERKMRVRCFESAFKLSFGNAARRDVVTYLVELRAYQRAATMFAHCSRFEDIYSYLRAMRRPLILLDYIEKRYKFLLAYRDNKRGGSQLPALLQQQKEQQMSFIFAQKEAPPLPPVIGAMESQLICLLCAIIQLKLEAINRLEANPAHDKEELQGLLGSLRDFTLKAVDTHRAAMQQPAINNTIGRLFTAHGRVDLMLAFSEKLGHVRYAIHFFISRGQFQEACKLLTERCSEEGEEEVWYAFAPRLIQHVPIQLINGMAAFRKGGGAGGGAARRALDPARLIPAFVHYRPSMNEKVNGRQSEGHKVIPYLRSCIRQDKNMDQLVHNFYVSLLAEYDVEILKQFLQQDDHIDYVGGHYRDTVDGHTVSLAERTTAYDPEYALRQCIKFHRHQYCVPLYKRLGLYEDAIAIALESTRPVREGSSSTAADGGNTLMWEGLTTVTDEILDKRPDWMDPATFKELWLGVARRVIAKVGTRDTLSVVERSKGILKLEDILPDIGDSTVIQDFKEAIVNSLNEYTVAINNVKQKEEEAKRVSATIKREIDTLQSRFGYVSSKHQCYLCHQGVFGSNSDRPFLVFPNCVHVFHEDCVIAHLERIDAVNLLKEEREELPIGYLDGIHTNEQVATLECIYCGECAIVDITAPMKEEEGGSSWAVPDFRRVN